MFLLEAEKHLALLGPEERGQKDDIKSTLQKLRSEHASLVEQATANLEKLKKDERVDLSLESIGSLIGLGVPGNYKTQCGYAADLNQQNPKPKAAATSSKQEPILNEEPKKEVASPPSASNNTPESRSAILRGLKSLWNQIISALVAIKKGVYTLASKLVAPFRRNNARRTRETPATTTTHRPEVVPQQQYTFNIQLPPPPSRSTPTSIFMPPSTAHILQRLQRERDESHRFANQQFERVRREMDDPNSFVNQRLQRMRREMDDPNGFVNQRLQQMHSHHHSYGSRPYSGQRFHQG